MPDPFSAALDVLFNAPGTKEGVYRASSEAEPVAIRVFGWSPDPYADLGEGSVRTSGRMLDIRVSDIAEPVEGATVTLGTETLEIISAPSVDSEGLTWRCEVAPVLAD